MKLLADLNRQGMTVVLVTHESEIAAWARRKIVFRDGRIVEDVVQAANWGTTIFGTTNDYLVWPAKMRALGSRAVATTV